jgi:hypothetical protein
MKVEILEWWVAFDSPTKNHCGNLYTQSPPHISEMSGMERALFNLKFTAKQIQRQAKKCQKEEIQEKTKLKKVGGWWRCGQHG